MGLFARLIVVVLGIMSLASLLVAGERSMVYLKQRRDSQKFAAKMVGTLGRGDLDGAARLDAGTSKGYLGQVIGAGLAAWSKSEPGDGELAFEAVARALDRQSQREIQNLKRGQGVLATVASTAPFVGLLGTVMGIVNSFQSMASSGSGGLGTVSAGIAEALVTTAFGLLVAIPAVMAYNYLQGWVDERAIDLSESSNELLDVVARRVRRAHVSAAAE
jgi:biopolymer transport protein ExbB/biopolymer transport protein TolQ